MSASNLQFVCDLPGTLSSPKRGDQRAFLPDTRLVHGPKGKVELLDSKAWVVSGTLRPKVDIALLSLAPRRHVLDSQGRLLHVPVSISESFILDSKDASLGGILGDLFVYGTLMRGECRFKILENECGLRSIQDGSVSGRLIDLGPYPGLVREGESPSRVFGEFCTLSNAPHALELLDEVEDFYGWEVSGSMYRRVLKKIRLGDGREKYAWTYEYQRLATRHPQIQSGDWRSR